MCIMNGSLAEACSFHYKQITLCMCCYKQDQLSVTCMYHADKLPGHVMKVAINCLVRVFSFYTVICNVCL